MRKTFRILSYTIPSVLVALVSFCTYKPTRFVLPESPYQFPAADAISGFLGTSNAKVVYTLAINGIRNVYYVDFNDSAPAPKKLQLPSPGNIGADSPLLSPDGTFVTYGLLQGKDAFGVYVQKLDGAAQPVLVDPNGAAPQWHKDSSGATYVIYSTTPYVASTDTIAPGTGTTYKRQVTLNASSGTAIVGAPEAIAPYPMNGGLSANGRYLCTGYQPAAFYDLQTGKLTMVNKGKQTCNPSIDPDPNHPGWMMFLNIDGPQNLNNESGTNYPGTESIAEHTVIFIADISNTVQNHIPISTMGPGYSAWQCPQWSNVPGFAAALASSDDGGTDWDLVLINVATKQNLKLTAGNGKLNGNSTPSLWVKN